MGARLIKLRNRTIAQQPATEARNGPYPFIVLADNGDLYGAHTYGDALRQASECLGTVYQADIAYVPLTPGHMRVVTFDHSAPPENTALAVKKRMQARQNQRRGPRKTARQRELDAKLKPGDDDFATEVSSIADKYIARTNGHHRSVAAQLLAEAASRPKKRRRGDEITDNREAPGSRKKR